MGCDIHLYVERKRDGCWVALPPPAPPVIDYRITLPDGTHYLQSGQFGGDPEGNGEQRIDTWYGPRRVLHAGRCYGPRDRVNDGGRCRRAGCPACLGTGRGLHWYQTRNYHVFRALTGTVRGPVNIPSITKEPRGVPVDLSETVQAEQSWDHSPSWLCLSELLKFKWPEGTETFQAFIHELLVPLATEVGTDNVRVVFGFDN